MKNSINFTTNLQLVQNENVIQQIGFYNGSIVVNGALMPTMIKGATLFWKEPDQNAGMLRALNQHTMFSGVYKKSNQIYTFKAAVSLQYEITIHDLKTGIDKVFYLVMGHKKEGDMLVNNNYLSFEKDSAPIGEVTRLDVLDNTHLKCRFDSCSANSIGFSYFDVVLNNLGDALNGYAWEIENKLGEADDIKKASHSISGVYIRKIINSFDMQSDMKLTDKELSLAQQVELRDNEEHFVEELASLTMPYDINKVNQNYTTVLEQLMLLAIDDEKRGFLGRKKPIVGFDVTNEQAEFLKDKDINDFLINEYYCAYVSSVMASSDYGDASERIKKVAYHDEKLKYYWKGNDGATFAQSKGYKKLSNPLYNSVYFMNCPQIKPYQQDAVKWAQKLQDYILATTNFKQYMGIYLDEKQPYLNHLIKILDELNDSNHIEVNEGLKGKLLISHGAYVHRKMVDKLLADKKIAGLSQDVYQNDNDKIMYIKKIAKSYIEELYNKKDLSEIEKQVKAEIEKAKLNGDIKDAPDYADIVIDTTSLIDLIVSATATDSILSIYAKLSNHPNITIGCQTIACIIIEVFYIWDIVAQFNDWRNLNDTDKAALFLQCLDAGSIAISTGYAIVQRLIDVNNARRVEAATEYSSSSSSLESLSNTTNASSVSKNMKSFKDTLVDKTARISKMARFLGVALSALAFALSVCSILQDKAEGYDNVVYGINIANTVISCISMLTAVGFFICGFFAVGASVIAASLPVIGWALAILGVILSIAVDIYKKNHPVGIVKYVSDVCVPFIEKLIKPTTEWLEEMKQQEAGLAK